MVNWFYDCYNILNKVYSDRAFFKQALNGTVIEEKNRALTVKTCYGVLDKDIELSYYIKELTDKSPKLVVRTILKISMYAIKYLGKHGYAVTKNAVELTKKLGKGGMSGFVNAVLRKFIGYDFKLPETPAEYVSVKYSFPLFAVKELISVYGIERTESILSVENDETCLSFFRTNGAEYLDALGINYTETPFDNVYSCKNFVRNSDYDKGVYTYQALGSVAICDAVEPCDKILDCCAAPGGKSIRLSYKCNSVTSWDIHGHRVGLIEDYKKRMGRENITVAVKDSKVYEPEYEGAFDAVLCDAPCSGLGVTRDNPDIKLNRDENSVSELNKEQTAILKNVSKYVKKGGYLYYSTCSLLDSENVAIAKAFMSDIKGFEVQEITSGLPFEKKEYGLQFLPDVSYGSGFYVVKFKRV